MGSARLREELGHARLELSRGEPAVAVGVQPVEQRATLRVVLASVAVPPQR